MRNKKGNLGKCTYNVLLCAVLFVFLASCTKDTIPRQEEKIPVPESDMVSEHSYEQDVPLIDLAAVAGSYTLAQAEADGLVIYSYNDASESEMSDGGERWAKFKHDVSEGTPSVIQFAVDLGFRVELWELEYDGQKVSRRLYSVDEYVNESFVYEVQYMLIDEPDLDMVSGYGGSAKLAEEAGCVVYSGLLRSVDGETALVSGGEQWERFIDEVNNGRASSFRLAEISVDKIKISDIVYDGETYTVITYNEKLNREMRVQYKYLVPIKCGFAGQTYTIWSLMLVEGFETEAELNSPNESSSPKVTAANIRNPIFYEK